MHTIINKLSNEKAPGPDKITAKKLKNLAKKTIVQIYYIFTACIRISYFPKIWKVVKIHPISKPGKAKTEIHNYKPISLLSILSKVLGKIIYIHLLRHLNENNIIIPHKYCLRANHSCTQLFRVTEHAITEHKNHTINTA